ncbi:beta-ketoacyl synthase N-terminal-like domain-containing protein [Streptomyces sp. HPF1205]|uniref:beta-ketoacyl synthase N-terminal-like domain-containing protein n=1 Tax=Streptomyces sp. HPF1205 TaxID=2873262 RepID=UPI001CED91E5|nr:beta-ketoacyl synthase N-terminal-like domain-containing protein [Streptomyces sp. HPF1205]
MTQTWDVTDPAGADAGARVLPLAVIGAGVVSPAGIGLDRLGLPPTGADGPADGPALPDGPDRAEYPPRPAYAVPELRLADHVGRKGIRYIDRMTALCLVAGRLALTDAPAEAPAGVPEDAPAEGAAADTGVVLGTSTGSVVSMADLAEEALTSELPYLVNPSRFPNTVMNSSAGQLAIRNALRGVNATIAGGQLSSLLALRYARLAIGQGRARRLVVGGVEELSARTAWAWEHSGLLAGGTALGEGCAMFVVDGRAEPAGPDCLAVLLACDVRYCGAPQAGPRAPAAGLVSAVRRALARSAVDPAEVECVALGSAGLRGLRHSEERAVAEALGRSLDTLAVIRPARTVGMTYSATGAMQLAALLAGWRRGDLPAGPALVTTIGPDGNVGCQVVRPGPRVRRHADR